MNKEFYGVCLFDDSKYAGDGWACRPGGSPIQINGVHDLGNDINWVTNLDYKTFMSNGLGKLRHICQSQFFRETITALLSDYGFGPSDNKRAAPFIAEHLNNTAIFGNTLLGIDPIRNRSNYRYSQMIQKQFENQLPILKQSARGISPELSDYICESSTQINQAMIGKISGTVPIHCHYPRLLYFRWLLSQPVPVSMDWKKISLSTDRVVGYRDGSIVNRGFLEGLYAGSISQKEARFFRISVLKTQSDYATYGGFGCGKSETREWVTMPELLNMCRYSLVSIKEIYSLPLGYLKDYVDFLPAFDNIPDISISAGLFMQNVAAAFMLQIDKKETPLTAYLRAYDRIGCFLGAEQLYALGVMPASFSMGRIVTVVGDDQIGEVKARMASIGMIPFIG